MFRNIRQDVQRYKRSDRESELTAAIRATYCHPAFLGVLFYRLSRSAWVGRRNPAFMCLHILLRVLYPLVRMYSGLELPPSVHVGGGLWIGHFGPVIVHPNVTIGANATILHGVTLGAAESGVPVLGDYVSMGAGAIVIGGVKVGDGAIVGAGAVVTRDVPEYNIAVGVPARMIPSGLSATNHMSVSDFVI